MSRGWGGLDWLSAQAIEEASDVLCVEDAAWLVGRGGGNDFYVCTRLILSAACRHFFFFLRPQQVTRVRLLRRALLMRYVWYRTVSIISCSQAKEGRDLMFFFVYCVVW